MADGSSPSLDLSLYLDQLPEEDKAKPQSPNPGLDLTQFVQDTEALEKENLAAAAVWAQKYQPDAYAKAATLLPGVPPEVAFRQGTQAEQIARRNAFAQLFDRAPSMRTHYLKNPKDLAYANPDELDHIEGIDWALSAFPQAFGEGMEQTSAGLEAYRILQENDQSIRARAFVTNYMGSDRTFGNQGDWMSSGLVNLAQTLPMMGSVIFNSMKRGLEGAVYGGTTGGAIGVLAGGAGAAPGVVAGAGVGFTTGTAYGALERNIQIQSGLNYLEFAKIKDEKGVPLDDQVARWAALLSGIGAGGLEQLGLAKTLGQVPGLDRLVGFMSKDGMKAALKNSATRNLVTQFAKRMGVAVSTEVLTEMGQEGLTILAGELAKTTDGDDFQMLTADEIIQRTAAAGIAAAQVMTLLGPVTAGAGFAGDIASMQRQRRQHNNLIRMATNLEGNALVERSPAQAAAVIDSQSGDQRVYIPAQEMKELYQSQGLDVYGPELPNWRQRFNEALATGGDVELTIGEFMTTLGKDPAANPLYGLVRTDPNDYMPQEMKEFADALDEVTMSDLQKAEKRVTQGQDVKPEVEDTRVKDMIREAVAATGFAPEAAEHYATVLDAFIQVKARQTGMDPVAWLEANGPNVMRETSDQTIQNAKQPDGSLGNPIEEFFQSVGMPIFMDQGQPVYAYDENYNPTMTSVIKSYIKGGDIETEVEFINGAISIDSQAIRAIDRAISELQAGVPLGELTWEAGDPDLAWHAVNGFVDQEHLSGPIKPEYIDNLIKSKTIYEKDVAYNKAALTQIANTDFTKFSPAPTTSIYDQVPFEWPDPEEELEVFEEISSWEPEPEPMGKAPANDLEFALQDLPAKEKSYALSKLNSGIPIVVTDDNEVPSAGISTAAKYLAYHAEMVTNDAELLAELNNTINNGSPDVSAKALEAKEAWKGGDYQVFFPDKAKTETPPLPEGFSEEVDFDPEPKQKLYRSAEYGGNYQNPRPWLDLMKGPQELPQSLMEKLDTPEFKQFYGDSVLTDSEGTPLVVYHGTRGHIDSRQDFLNFNKGYRKAAFFSTNPKFASSYSDSKDQGRMFPVFIRMERPAGQNWEMLEKLGPLTIKPEVLAEHGSAKAVAEFIASHENEYDRKAAWIRAMHEDLHELVNDTRIVFDLYNDMGRGARKQQNYWEDWSTPEYLNGLFRKAGFDGYFEIEGGSINMGVFEPTEQVKSIFNRGTFDRADPDILRQENRGSISFPKKGPALIKLFDKADMSTMLHEAGHFFLQTTRDLAPTSPEIDADWQVIKKHLGVGDDNKITREQHERFARMAEAYFMEGKAPTPQLRSAFQAFRQWLKTLYRSITKVGGKVNPEIAAVFDNMLRTERQFDQVANEPAYRPLFTDAESMGISTEDYLAYQNLVEDLRAEAQDATVGRVVGQAAKFSKGWFAQIERQLAVEAEEKLRKLPPYSHLEVMKRPEFSINTELFLAKYSKESAKKFPAKVFNKTGLDPEVAANLLGYPTADEMVHDFGQAPPIKEQAKIEAKAEMTRRYGDDFSQQQIIDLAVRQAMAADGRTTILAKEYKALSAKAGRTVSEVSPRQMAAEIARRSLYGKRFLDVNERKAQAAVRRASIYAEQAVLKGDWSTAADWKRKQLLAQALANETERLNVEVRKIRDKAARYTRTASKSIDPSTMEQIRALVTQYEFAKVPLKKLARRQSLAQYLADATANGLVVNIPDHLLRQLDRKNYKEMTVEELFGLGSTLDNLEHVGRLKHKLRTAKGLREFAEVKSQVVSSIRQRPSKKITMLNYAEEKKTAFTQLKAWHTTLIKPEQIIKWLDVDNIAGPMMEYVFQPIADAQNAQNDLMVKYTKKIMDSFDKIPSDYLTETRVIQSLRTNMTMEQIYAVALNLGNDSNKQRMMTGELWKEDQVAEIISHLDKKDWDRIQNIWNTLDSLWEKISKLEKKLTGVAPPRVEGREFTNQFGTYKGGYYPVIYDFQARRGLNLIEDTRPEDWKLDGLSLFNPRYVKPGTNHTHTYARTSPGKPIKLELGVLPGHIQKVLHDLTYREPVRAAYKLLSDPEVQQAITDVEGKDAYDQLSHWIHQVAIEHAVENNPQVQLITKLRLGAQIFGMGYRATTAIAQGLGYFNTLAEVGVKYTIPAIYRMTVNPWQSLEAVNAMSGEMRHRFNQQDRDIRDFTQKITVSKTKLDYIREYAFFHIGALDKWVATASWMAAYNKALEADPKNPELAIRTADRVVRLTQGTGTVKDMAKVMNSGEVLKLFTMFYSAFSAIYNMQVDLTRRTKRDIAEGDWATILTQRLPQWSYLVMFPAVLGALLSGQGPEDDENIAWWVTKKTLLYPIAGIPYARDVVASASTGFDYKFTPAGKLYEQTAKSLSILFDSDKEFVDRAAAAAKPVATAASLYFKLPTGQAISTLEGLWKGIENNDLEIQDLIYGRRDK